MMPHFTAPSGEEEWISLCDSYSKIEVLQKYIHVYLGSGKRNKFIHFPTFISNSM